MRWQLAKVELEQARNGVRVVVLGALEQVDVSLGVEAVLEDTDNVGTAREAEDAFFVLGVLSDRGRVSAA